MTDEPKLKDGDKEAAILACPFCGSWARQWKHGTAGGQDAWWIGCNNCQSEGPMTTPQSKEQAIIRWNEAKR